MWIAGLEPRESAPKQTEFHRNNHQFYPTDRRNRTHLHVEQVMFQYTAAFIEQVETNCSDEIVNIQISKDSQHNSLCVLSKI